MSVGEAIGCAAMRALSLCSGNIHSENVAQFTCGSIPVKVVVGV
jgi:hypothetical protein